MLSIPLGLPEFKVIKQFDQENCFVFEVEKSTDEERCPFCGFKDFKRHGDYYRTVRDLSILERPLYLQVHVLRFHCQNCDEVFCQSFESIKGKQRQTKRYRQFLYELCLETTIQDVSKKQKIPYTTLERIFYDVAHEKAKDQREIDTETVIGVDEVAVRKGHSYETVFTNLVDGHVIGMTKDRTQKAVSTFIQNENVLSSEHVKTVVIDMWEPFYHAVRSHFPHANVVIDKYHVVQKVIQALDQVRKDIQSKDRSLKKSRLLLLKSTEKLKDWQKEKLDRYFENTPELALAYFLKERFRDIYQALSYVEAKNLLSEWYELVADSPFLPFKKAAKTIQKWEDEILQFFISSYTNARTEGTNNKIKNIKRRSYGFRNRDRFRIRVKLECTGKRKLKELVA